MASEHSSYYIESHFACESKSENWNTSKTQEIKNFILNKPQTKSKEKRGVRGQGVIKMNLFLPKNMLSSIAEQIAGGKPIIGMHLILQTNSSSSNSASFQSCSTTLNHRVETSVSLLYNKTFKITVVLVLLLVFWRSKKTCDRWIQNSVIHSISKRKKKTLW